MAAVRRAEVTWQGDLARGSGTVTAASSNAFSELPITWGSRTERADGRTSPEELIAAAHASCFSMAFSAQLGERGITPEAIQRLVNDHWPGNVRQLRNLIESMVVLAPGAEIRASDIPQDVLEGPGSLLPMRLTPAGQQGSGAGMQELEFILRSLVDLRLQIEELRRRIDQPQRVQVIELGNHAQVHDVIGDEDQDGQQPVLYRSGMTMADVEKATIEAALREYKGNRRRAAEVLGIGERTLYRKIKAYHLE